MSKKFKKGAAIVLSTAMIAQLGLQDGMLYVRADEEDETVEKTQLGSDANLESNEEEVVQENPNISSLESNDVSDEQISDPESAPTQDSQVQSKVSANLLVMNTNATNQVKFVDENNNSLPTAPSNVTAGIIEDIVKQYTFEGYDFVNATVNGDEIYSIGVFGDTWYYVPKNDTNTGLLLGNSIITFNYQTHVETYTVTYNTSSLVYEGPESVKEGESYSFTTKPSGKGKKLNVVVNDHDITNNGVVVDNSTGLMRYTVDNVTTNQNVVITESDVETYIFTYDNDSESFRQGHIASPKRDTQIVAGGSITFDLISDLGGGIKGNIWHLNMLAINGEFIEVPTSYDEGASSESVLSTGEKVTITLVDDRYDVSLVYPNQKRYQYKVTISNVYTNIKVTEINFKNAERNEIILKRLDGVSEITGWDAAENDGKGNYRLGGINSVYLQTKRDGNEFYFNLQPGYTNPVVSVLADGKKKDIEVYKVSEMHPGDVTANGYEYRINIKSGLSDNVEVYIASEKQYYNVEYKVGDNTPIADKNTYTIFDGDRNELLLPEAPAYDTKNCIFEGWEYDGKIYQPNEVFQFNENTIQGAKQGVITFTAKLIPIEGSDYVKYTVEFLFQNEDGSYVEKEEYPNEEGYGIKNQELFYYKALTMEVKGYVLDDIRSDITLNLENDENNIARIYFKLDSNGDGTADEDEDKYTIRYETGTEDEVANMPETQTNVLKNTEQPVSTQVPTREGYVFSGWTTKDVTVEGGTFTMPAKDVTFTATWKEDKNHDNKPDDAQTLTIKFEAGDGSFVEDTIYSFNVLPGEDYPVAPGKEQIVAPEGQAFRYFADEEGQAYNLSGKVPEDQETATLTYTAVYGKDSNGDGTADEDEDKELGKPENSGSNKDSEKTDGEDTAAATNVGIFASLATSALAGLGILAALKKRRKD